MGLFSQELALINRDTVSSNIDTIKASLSEPHTNEKLGIVVTYKQPREKAYLVSMIVHVTKDN